MSGISDVTTEAIKRAFKFYEESPDGQYDIDVAAPALGAVIAVREMCQSEIDADAKYGVHGGGSGPNLARKIAEIVGR